MPTFSPHEILTLIDQQPRYELGDSIGPSLRLADLLSPELADLELGYGTGAGDAELRRAIAERYGVGPDDVVVTVGGVHGVFLLSYLLVEPGAQVVMTAPLFPITRTIVESLGADVRVVPLTFDEGYRLTADAVRAHLTPDTRLVSLTTPQNPSGVAIPLSTLREVAHAMAEICPTASLLVDDTYRTAVYGDAPLAHPAVSLGPRVVSVASVSKCHGAAGLRIGWVVTTDAELVAALIMAKAKTVISHSPVSEALALRLFAREDEILAERRSWLAENLAMTEDWVRANSDLVEWVRPDAGATCAIRLGPAVDLDRFRQETAELGAHLAHGEWFDDVPNVSYLGFGFLPPADLKGALDALRRALLAPCVRRAG
jgi:aspartate/methionine/tyrosine aminotransferase